MGTKLPNSIGGGLLGPRESLPRTKGRRRQHDARGQANLYH